jgi:hypothetical protein
MAARSRFQDKTSGVFLQTGSAPIGGQLRHHGLQMATSAHAKTSYMSYYFL